MHYENKITLNRQQNTQNKKNQNDEKQKCEMTITVDVGVVADVAACVMNDWNVGASRFDDATFSWIELMVFVSHGCQLLRLLWNSAISVFSWCVRSWLQHCDSTSSSLVCARLSSSSLICLVACSMGSNGPRLSRVCLMRVLSPLGTSMQSVSWQSVSVAEHDSHFDDFSYKTSGKCK